LSEKPEEKKKPVRVIIEYESLYGVAPVVDAYPIDLEDALKVFEHYFFNSNVKSVKIEK
jgi:hypothetical protein